MLKRGDPLSPREFQVMKATLDGKTRMQVSKSCYISESAIGAHMYRVRKKLGVANNVELAKLVTQIGVNKIPVFNPATQLHTDVGRIPMGLYRDDDNS